MKTVYLGLGSNVGDRQENLAEAVRRLESPKLRVIKSSSIWETEPRDVPNQPWFLNQVIQVETDVFPRQLLARTQRIERDMGRIKIVPKGPRIIDIDILLYGGSIIHSAELDIPHCRLAERRFVLEPLAELAPDLRHPVTRQTVREMLAKVASQPARRF